MTVQHDAQHSRFFIPLHTDVPASEQGQGIAAFSSPV